MCIVQAGFTAGSSEQEKLVTWSDAKSSASAATECNNRSRDHETAENVSCGPLRLSMADGEATEVATATEATAAVATKKLVFLQLQALQCCFLKSAIAVAITDGMVTT